MRRPKTRNGCADAWYFTSFLIGSGKKYLAWKKICTASHAEVYQWKGHTQRMPINQLLVS